MSTTADSLFQFIEGAKFFLRNEMQISITDEQAKYLIVYHFDSFTNAYMRYRENPGEVSSRLLCGVVMRAAELHEYHTALNPAMSF